MDQSVTVIGTVIELKMTMLALTRTLEGPPSQLPVSGLPAVYHAPPPPFF